ncbi:tRNA (guanosine(46)-N7)-methyltransferase TrmB [Limisalsivibrio acetivorans]|uniref:tRNA (guanosine(46)-N7)-methyltransferase TrmB n=1 Tax=Limisalsivibrio acetivorans TaxID=1304888 RepID=UPI001EE21516|nr:tRNA (guanosine(46)-N7)-methyltransferase TrmB [Limisalsivibrio acetivorans]
MERFQKYSHGGGFEDYERLKPSDFFGNDAPFNVEIGIGNGEFIAGYAEKNPDQNYLGFEVMKRIFNRAVKRAGKLEQSNVRLIHFDATFFVTILEDECVDNFYVNFPDPWPKKRHKKRRLLKTEFIELLTSKLKPGGSLYMATDQADYAQEIMENLKPLDSLETAFDTVCVNELVDYLPTKYYRKFADENGVFFFRMVKKG